MKEKDRSVKFDWYVDSGSGRNRTPFGDIVVQKTKSNINTVSTANNSNLCVKSMGKVHLNISSNKIEVNDCLHVPDLSVN